MTTKNNRQAELPTTKDTIKVDIPYFQTPNAIFDLKEVETIFQLTILLYLHRCGNQGAVAFPSYGTMATKCRMCRRTAINTIKSLIESGILIKTVTPFKANTYTISLPSAPHAPPSAPHAPPSAPHAPYKELYIKNLTTTRRDGHKNLFKVYEDNIGILTPLIADKLKDIANEYSTEWFEEAIKEACEANIRKLNYIVAILKRWQVDGFKAPKPEKRPRIVKAEHSISRYKPTN